MRPGGSWGAFTVGHMPDMTGSAGFPQRLTFVRQKIQKPAVQQSVISGRPSLGGDPFSFA